MGYSDSRILVINSESITKNNATGITLRSIFSQVSSDNFLEISCSPVSNEIYYRNKKMIVLPHRYVLPLLLLELPFMKKMNNTAHQLKHQSNKVRLDNWLISSFKSVFLKIVDVFPLIKPKKVINEVNTFQPDVIYTLGASLLVLRLCDIIARETNKKIIIHHMDNWVNTIYANSPLMSPFRWLTIRKLSSLYKKSSVSLAISETMASYLTKKFKVSHFPLMNVIDSISNEPRIDAVDNVISILYTGGLHLERWKTLIEVSKEIEELNSNGNIRINLVVYTDDTSLNKYKHLFNYFESTIFKCYIPHDEILDIMLKSDILIHFESFEKRIFEYIRFSVSTKISEYLSIGKPIILFAPKELAMFQYLNAERAAICVNNSRELSMAINQLINSKQLRYELARNALICANRKHSRVTAKNTLEKAINSNL